MALVTIVGILLAFVAGRMVAQGDYSKLALVAGAAVAFTVATLLGKRYWVLIPFTFGATGAAGAIPIPFNYSEMGIMAAFGLFLLHVALKKVDHSYGKFGWVDALLWLNIVYLITVYVRYPVGVRAFATELVGGRPYFALTLSLFGYIVLCHSRLLSKEVKRFTLAFVILLALPGVLVVTSEFVPGISKVVYPFYSGVSIEAFRVDGSTANMGNESERITSLTQVSKPIVQALCAYFSPATLVNPLYLGRFFMFVACLAMIGLSGFRNHIVLTGAFMTISAILRKQYASLVFLGMAGILGVITVAGLHLAGVQIAAPIQRSLSFIPLGWDDSVVADADSSKEWRVDMWTAAWNSPNYMRNKVLGDGFGFTFQEMMIMSDAELGIAKILGSEDTFEGHLLRGSYHNGPLSAIKFVGFVGLFLQLAFMYALFKYTLRVLKKSEGTNFYVLTMFLALPILYLPFEFIFIFGAYQNAMSLMLFSTGMLKMLDSSMEAENDHSEVTIQKENLPSRELEHVT